MNKPSIGLRVDALRKAAKAPHLSEDERGALEAHADKLAGKTIASIEQFDEHFLPEQTKQAAEPCPHCPRWEARVKEMDEREAIIARLHGLREAVLNTTVAYNAKLNVIEVSADGWKAITNACRATAGVG